MIWEHTELIIRYIVLLAVFTFLVFSIKTAYKWDSNQAISVMTDLKNGI